MTPHNTWGLERRYVPPATYVRGTPAVHLRDPDRPHKTHCGRTIGAVCVGAPPLIVADSPTEATCGNCRRYVRRDA